MKGEIIADQRIRYNQIVDMDDMEYNSWKRVEVSVVQISQQDINPHDVFDSDEIEDAQVYDSK